MHENTLFKTNRHACYNLKYRLVVVTKYRHHVINKDIAHNIFEISWGCHLLSIETNQDHIHILFDAPPQVQLSNLINNFKTVSSRLVRKEFAEFLSSYYWKPYFWNHSYYIGAVSDTTEEVVKQYIENQQL